MISRRLRPAAWVILGLGLVLLLWCIAAAVALIPAYRSLRNGQATAETAAANFSVAAIGDPAVDEQLEDAQNDFGRAHSITSSPFTSVLRVLPFAGRQVRSVNALASAAEQTCAIARRTKADVDIALRAPFAQRAERAPALRKVAEATGVGATSISALDLGPKDHLIGPLRVKREKLSSRLEVARRTLAEAAAASRAGADLLEGPSRYVVLLANNAEMRSGSGEFLQVGLLEGNQGSLHLSRVATTSEFAGTEGVPPNQEMDDRWKFFTPNRDMRGLMASPQFPSNASLAAAIWSQRTGVPVDGAMALDVVAFKALLSVTGPVQIGDTAVDAQTIEQYLLRDQYVAAGDEQGARKDRLADTAGAVFDAFEAGSYDVVALGRALGDAARGRHMMLWSRDAAVEQVWTEAGVGGQIGPSSLLVSVLNIGGSKLDPYLDVRSEISTAPRGKFVDVTVAVTVTNNAPADLTEYQYGFYNELKVPKGTYRGVLSVHVPAGTGGLALEGSPPLFAAGNDGPSQVIATVVTVSPGATTKTVARFTVAPALVRVEPSARIPAVTWNQGGDEWPDVTAKNIPLWVER